MSVPITQSVDTPANQSEDVDCLVLSQEVFFGIEDIIGKVNETTYGMGFLEVGANSKRCSESGGPADTQELAASHTSPGPLFRTFEKDLSPIRDTDLDQFFSAHDGNCAGAVPCADSSVKRSFAESSQQTCLDTYAEAVSLLTDFDSEDTRKDTADAADAPEFEDKKENDSVDATAQANSLSEDLVSRSDTSFEISSSDTDHNRDIVESKPRSYDQRDAGTITAGPLDQADKQLIVKLALPKASGASKRERSKNSTPTVFRRSPIGHRRRSNNKPPNYTQYTKIDILSRWDEYKTAITERREEFDKMQIDINGSLEAFKCHFDALTAGVQEAFKEENIRFKESQKGMEDFENLLNSMAFD